jgi:hypothetical protein
VADEEKRKDPAARALARKRWKIARDDPEKMARARARALHATKARQKKLSKAQASENARRAVQARWDKEKGRTR